MTDPIGADGYASRGGQIGHPGGRWIWHIRWSRTEAQRQPPMARGLAILISAGPTVAGPANRAPDGPDISQPPEKMGTRYPNAPHTFLLLLTHRETRRGAAFLRVIVHV